MKRERDSQRSRMYASEWECFGWAKMEFEKIADVEKYAWEVLENRHIQNKFPIARGIVAGEITFEVRNGAGSRRARASHALDDHKAISMPRRSRAKHVVLHELAHVLTPYGLAPHGREFCQNMLYLVRIMMGREKEKQFKAAMKKHKCKYSKPHSPFKEPLTEEQKQERIARLKGNKNEN